MKLDKKKNLAARVLGVGKGRIIFDSSRLEDLKEVITKQDIRDLYKEGVIKIKNIKGRRKIEKRKHKRGPGKIKKRVNKKKRDYVRITRKLRQYALELKKQGKISVEDYRIFRKKVKAGVFKSKAQFKENLGARK